MPTALVVVAHPDDETIWMGGTIIKNKGWQWRIISLCRKHDLDRSPKFFKACMALNAECEMSDLDDDSPEKPLAFLDEVTSRIKELSGGNEFDFIFTHGGNGEYGHNRHKEVHRAVEQMVARKELVCRKLFFFSYLRDKKFFRAVPSKKNNFKLSLRARELRKKKYLITNVYGFNERSFETLSCSAVETFRMVIVS